MRDVPIFKNIFGDQWECLPHIMRKRYANRAYCNDCVEIKGIMNIYMSRFARFLRPFMRISGALVPLAGNNIPVEVYFRSEENTNHFIFDRAFYFPNQSPYFFKSYMMPIRNNEIIEFMPIGIGWNACYSFDGTKVIIKHQGYSIKVFSKLLRFPLEWLLGEAYAEEEALDNNQFKMRMTIQHPLWGKIYEYSGIFELN